MLLSRSHHLAAGIKAKVMATSFLPLCLPLDGDSDLTASKLLQKLFITGVKTVFVLSNLDFDQSFAFLRVDLGGANDASGKFSNALMIVIQ